MAGKGGFFTPLHRAVWRDEKVLELSAPPSARLLWVFLLTGHHTQGVPGLFCLSVSAMADEMRWPVKDTQRVLNECIEKGLTRIDAARRVVFVPNAIQYRLPANPSIVSGWRSVLAEIPDCPLKVEGLAKISAEVKALGEGYAAAMEWACGRGKRPESPNKSGVAKNGKASPKPAHGQGDGGADGEPHGQPHGVVQGVGNGVSHGQGDGGADGEPHKERDRDKQKDKDLSPQPPAKAALPAKPAPEADGVGEGAPRVSIPTREQVTALDADLCVGALGRWGGSGVVVQLTDPKFTREVLNPLLVPLAEQGVSVAHFAVLGAWCARRLHGWTERKPGLTDLAKAGRLTDWLSRSVAWWKDLSQSERDKACPEGFQVSQNATVRVSNGGSVPVPTSGTTNAPRIASGAVELPYGGRPLNPATGKPWTDAETAQNAANTKEFMRKHRAEREAKAVLAAQEQARKDLEARAEYEKNRALQEAAMAELEATNAARSGQGRRA